MYCKLITNQANMLKLYILALVLHIGTALGYICPQYKQDVCEVLEYNNGSATANQLVLFAEGEDGPIGYLTSATGTLLEKATANEAVNGILITNRRLFEGLTSLVREPTLPRVVHAKGGGAYGYFVVTHDVTDITNIAMFNKTGKKTPVTVRFSNTAIEFGGYDTNRDNRGFAVKFKTPEGIFDLLSLTFPVFSIKDPIKFPSFTHTSKRNPQTHRIDYNMLWDFITFNPESLFFFLHFYSDIGIPCSYTKLPGNAIHTFAFCNDKGERFFGRFSWTPDAGVEGLSSADAVRLAGENPDYLNQDLYDRIACGENPSWTLYVQPLSEEDLEKATFNVFDTTWDLDPKVYPRRPIGKMYLNKNTENFMRDVEPLAFCVRNLVPGIQGVDPLFLARFFVYLDAQNQRLGPNHQKIPANSPKPYADPETYYRDGMQPLNSNGNNGPNYYPNSFYGPIPVAKPQCPEFDKKIFIDPKPTNFEQAADYFNGLSKDEQGRVVENIVESLSYTTAEFLQKRAIYWFTKIDKTLGSRIEAALAARFKCTQPVKKS